MIKNKKPSIISVISITLLILSFFLIITGSVAIIVANNNIFQWIEGILVILLGFFSSYVRKGLLNRKVKTRFFILIPLMLSSFFYYYDSIDRIKIRFQYFPEGFEYLIGTFLLPTYLLILSIFVIFNKNCKTYFNQSNLND